MKYSQSERRKIAGFLKLEYGSDDCDVVISAIEDWIKKINVDYAREEAHWNEQIRAGKVGPRPRGAPAGRSVDIVAKAAFLGWLYTFHTQDKIKNSSAHPFYKLLQLCLRYSDPSHIIKALKRPPWADSVASRFDKNVPSARKLVFEAIAEALKPDPT